MELINRSFEFTCYKNLLSSEKAESVINVNDLIEVIKYGYLEKEVNAIRHAGSKEKRNELKKTTLPAITTSGIFEPRSSNGFKKHNGLIQIDIDYISNYEEQFQNLIKDKFTYVAFRSPSGNGIKLLVKINPSHETHLGQFNALKEYYEEEFQVEIDKACKDIARCMLLSYDPHLYCNPNSAVFDGFTVPEPKFVSKERHSFFSNMKNEYYTDDEKVVAFISRELAERKLDITQAYENWIQIGFALANTLGETGRVYYHEISSVYPEYNSHELDKVYSGCLKRNDGRVTLGTLIYHAKSAGVDLSELYTSDKLTPKKNMASMHLYDSIKEWRYKKSRQINKPAFTIFSNKVLKQLIEIKPKTEEELLNIKGLGKTKVERFGRELLDLIKQGV